MSTIRAVFLDRDGTINVNRPDYVKSVAEFEFLPGALEALALLSTLPVKVYVLTNQSAIMRELMTRQELTAITEHTEREINRAGGRIDGYFHCPHTRDSFCYCRKPRTGMLEQAAKLAGAKPNECVMIGDGEEDVFAATRFGAVPLLVYTGRGIDTIKAVGAYELRRLGVLPCNDLLWAVRLVGHLL